MFPVRRSRDRLFAIALHGDAAAWALCARVAGDPDDGSGWTGALHAAADASDYDDELLRIADDIFVLAPILTDGLAVRRYAEAVAPELRGSVARTFVAGMLVYVDDVAEA